MAGCGCGCCGCDKPAEEGGVASNKAVEEEAVMRASNEDNTVLWMVYGCGWKGHGVSGDRRGREGVTLWKQFVWKSSDEEGDRRWRTKLKLSHNMQKMDETTLLKMLSVRYLLFLPWKKGEDGCQTRPPPSPVLILLAEEANGPNRRSKRLAIGDDQHQQQAGHGVAVCQGCCFHAGSGVAVVGGWVGG